MVQPVQMATPDPKGLGQTAEEKAAAEAYIAHLAALPEAIKEQNAALLASTVATVESESDVTK